MKYVISKNYDIAIDILEEIKDDLIVKGQEIAENERIIESIMSIQNLIEYKKDNLYEDIKKKKLEIIEYAFNKISNAEELKYKIGVKIIKDNLDNPILRVIAYGEVYILEVSGCNIYFYLLSAGTETGFIIPLSEWDTANGNMYKKDVYIDNIISRLSSVNRDRSDMREGKNILDLRYYDASKVNKSYNDIYYDLTVEEVVVKIRTAIEGGNLLEFVLNGKTFDADSYCVGIEDLIV